MALKKIFSVLFLLLTGALSAQENPFTWMSGHWLLNGSVHEVWHPSGESLSGRSYKVTAEGDTVVLEQLTILRVSDRWVYRADVAGNSAPVDFTLTEQSWGMADFRNPQHDDPQQIRYQLTDTGMRVRLYSEMAGERILEFRRLP